MTGVVFVSCPFVFSNSALNYRQVFQLCFCPFSAYAVWMYFIIVISFEILNDFFVCLVGCFSWGGWGGGGGWVGHWNIEWFDLRVGGGSHIYLYLSIYIYIYTHTHTHIYWLVFVLFFVVGFSLYFKLRCMFHFILSQTHAHTHAHIRTHTRAHTHTWFNKKRHAIVFNSRTFGNVELYQGMTHLMDREGENHFEMPIHTISCKKIVQLK